MMPDIRVMFNFNRILLLVFVAGPHLIDKYL